jgi:glycosyltransferase involved in cell wall biosynthesis
MPISDPIVSVVLIVGRNRQRGEGALESVLSQDGIDKAEVLLVDTCPPDMTQIRGSDHPSVRLIRETKSVHMGVLRAIAVQKAKGRIVAFIEEHARALEGWLEGIITAFEEGWAGVGPEMHNASQGAGISESVGMVFYLDWRPPATAGESDLIPGHDSSYLREALLSLGEDMDEMLLCDTLMQWRLQEMGYQLGIDPQVKIAHMNEARLSTVIQGSFLWHRCFGRLRARYQHWNFRERLLRILATPLVPVFRSARMYRVLRNNRPKELPMFWRVLPLLFVHHSVAALGMLVGYLFGLGDAPLLLTRYELEIDRDL